MTPASIRKLNNDFRQVDSPTDVLSFPGSDHLQRDLATGRAVYLGDIAICIEIAREQASEYGHSLQREMAYLTTHGVLHLLGFDHERPEDQTVMRSHEEKVMAALGLTR